MRRLLRFALALDQRLQLVAETRLPVGGGLLVAVLVRVHASVGDFDAGVAVGGVFKLEDDVGVVPLGVLEQVAGGLDAPDEAVALLGFGDVELGELVVVLEVELAAGGVCRALDGFVPPLLWPGDCAEDFGAARRDLEGGGDCLLYTSDAADDQSTV